MTEAATEVRSVVVEREMPYPPERIWRALTQPHLIAEWLMKNDFQPTVGRQFSLRTQPHGDWNGVIDCEVLEVEPHKTLAYTWGSGHEALHVKTIVTWTLTPTGTGTHLRMEQSGFRSDQPQNYNGAAYGWRQFFANLEQLLAKAD